MTASLNTVARVRVTKRPKGEPPEEVRDGWIGVEFEGTFTTCLQPGDRVGVKSGEPEQSNSNIVVTVPQAEALAALREKSPKAWEWWNQNGFPQSEQLFVFNNDECAMIGTPQIVRTVQVNTSVVDGHSDGCGNSP